MRVLRPVRWTSSLGVAVLAGAILITAISLVPDTAFAGGDPGAPVYVTGGKSTGKPVYDIGDSITRLTASNLEWSLKQDSYVINATPSITMAKSLPAIKNAVATMPAQNWVIELGTNDAYNNNAQADLRNEIDAVSGQLCVILVTISPRLGDIATSLNQSMWWQAYADPKFHVLDWGNIEYNNPHWVTTDNVHPAKQGKKELALLERRALKDFCKK